jgi:hypothetical protein
VLKNSGRFVVLDPIIEEAKDAIDIALETRSTKCSAAPTAKTFAFTPRIAFSVC